MLRLTPFRYVRPDSSAEAFEIFNAHRDEASYLGGGTDLLPNIKHRLAEPKIVIGLRPIHDLQGMRVDEDQSTRIGGAVTLWDLQRSPIIREQYPALCVAASLISTPQVQRTGTLGGN